MTASCSSDLAPIESPVSFTLGEAFDSFVNLEKKIVDYKLTNFVEFWKRDTRTIAVA